MVVTLIGKLQVLADNGGRHFQSIDTGITGYKARHNLAVVYEEMGRHAQAEAEWRQVVDEEPAYRPGWRGLGDSLLQQDKLTEAEELSVELKSRDALCGAGAVLAARIAERADNIATATSELQAVLAQSTDDLEPLRELCRLTFERRGPSAAAQWLRQLADRDPGDASALHNLGTACLAEGRAEEAADWFQRSLDVRPNSLSTRTQLEAAHATRVVAENHQSA